MLDVSALRLARGYWYLASPYSKWAEGIDDAAHVIAKVAGKLIRQGLPVFSPIAHSHTVARAAAIDPYSHEIWLAADKPIFEGAAGMIVAALPGWRESFGIGEEVKWCREHDKPVWLLDVETLTLAAL